MFLGQKENFSLSHFVSFVYVFFFFKAIKNKIWQVFETDTTSTYYTGSYLTIIVYDSLN